MHSGPMYKVMGANGRESPPVSHQEVLGFIRDGTIKPQTLIFDATTQAWLKAEDHPAFRTVVRESQPLLRPQSPTPPPPYSQPTPTKICPNCRQPALIEDTVCAKCGHAFRTNFANQTQLNIPPPQQATAPPVVTPIRNTWTPQRIFWAILGFIFFGGLCVAGSNMDAGNDDMTAWAIAKKFVRENLKAPTSADFPGFSEATVEKVAENRYRVSSYVDSQNSFGAMLRSDWSCTVDYAGGGEWRLRALAIGDNVIVRDPDVPRRPGVF